MSYTQWDKGFYDGWNEGYHHALDDIRQYLLEHSPRASLEVFEALNELNKNYKDNPAKEAK